VPCTRLRCSIEAATAAVVGKMEIEMRRLFLWRLRATKADAIRENVLCVCVRLKFCVCVCECAFVRRGHDMENLINLRRIDIVVTTILIECDIEHILAVNCSLSIPLTFRIHIENRGETF
jgi:hypothetical protein